MTYGTVRSCARLGAILGLALGATACSVVQPPDPSAGAGATGELADGPGLLPAPPPRTGTCRALGAPGQILWTRALGSANALDAHTLVADTAGHVLFARGARTSATSALVGQGEVQLAQLDGAVRAQFPAGVAVAADAHGNAFVAGSFTQPVDFGLGVMTPAGNVDVFVVELDAKGRVIAQRQLGLCGDGVSAIAVAADGRVAVSGTAMGTAVVDAGGAIAFTVPYRGKVAFDSHGELVVAGSFTGSLYLGGTFDVGAASGGFVAAFDPAGQLRWSHVLTATSQNAPRDVYVTGVAIDAHDRIAIGGYTDGSVDVLGTTVTALYATESGRISGGFAAELDASGAAIWAEDAFLTDLNAIAIAPDGSLAVAGAFTGNAGFFRITAAEKLAPSGSVSWTRTMFPASGYGTGLAVALDGCDAVYVAAIALDTANPGSPDHAYAIKLAP